jgi:predicted metal-dependent HD superfamily phosphohydrolase
MPSRERWRATWSGLSVAGNDDRLYGELIDLYSDKKRSYHTVQHLDECFARLDEAREFAGKFHEIELALWFHDAIYDVRKDDNEERSAAWAGDVALRAGVPQTASTRIHGLIIATKHNVIPDTADAKVIVDVDLSILGAPMERFNEYERQVRQEYSWVPGWLFRRKRREILTGFLSRPHIYNTEHFIATLEAQARANLERSVKALGG